MCLCDCSTVFVSLRPVINDQCSPNELPDVTLKINVGFSAETVRTELVLLATALDAGVPPSSIHFINNGNGTVTSDFIQVSAPASCMMLQNASANACNLRPIESYYHTFTCVRCITSTTTAKSIRSSATSTAISSAQWIRQAS